MNNSVAFSTFTVLCNQHFQLVPEHFHHVKIIWFLLSSHSPFLPPPLATTNLCFLSLDLPILGISHTRNHIICDLLCVASFTQHHVFHSSMLQHVSVFHSFTMPAQYSTVQIYHNLFIHLPLIDIWNVSSFGLL